MENEIRNICYNGVTEMFKTISERHNIDENELFSLIIYGEFIDEKIIKEGDKYYVLDSKNEKYLELDETNKTFKYMF